MTKPCPVTNDMKKRAVISCGDKNRLFSVMNKARRGETVTFAVIGGSITQGCHADVKSESYAELVHGWWKRTFPGTVINYINAGIGATDSYIGVHRADSDLISCSPDVVIVEFSVNDSDKVINPRAYDSLLRKLLRSERNTAVILLFTMTQKGESMQEEHMKSGMLYGLPMISYKNAVFPELENNTLDWKDISPDDIHPSSAGHRIISELIISYLDIVFDELLSDVITMPFDTPSPYGDIYEKAVLSDNRSISPIACEGFEKSSASYQFPYGWTTICPGVLEFEVCARNIGVMYYRTTYGDNGIYSVLVDDNKEVLLDGDFPGGWGSFADYREVFTSDFPAVHRVKIIPSENTKNTKFSVLGLCLS